MSFKDNDEERVMHSKSVNIKIMINDKAGGASRYQIGLEVSLKCSSFAFGCVDLLHYKCHKINPDCAGSYADPLA